LFQPLYVLAKDVKESLEERFKSQIKQSYNRVADSGKGKDYIYILWK
jgi:hypothetical protein